MSSTKNWKRRSSMTEWWRCENKMQRREKPDAIQPGSVASNLRLQSNFCSDFPVLSAWTESLMLTSYAQSHSSHQHCRSLGNDSLP